MFGIVGPTGCLSAARSTVLTSAVLRSFFSLEGVRECGTELSRVEFPGFLAVRDVDITWVRIVPEGLHPMTSAWVYRQRGHLFWCPK